MRFLVPQTCKGLLIRGRFLSLVFQILYSLKICFDVPLMLLANFAYKV